MATPLHSESRRSYSWWWSSHISPKNSKWLQGNLTEMDAKVKEMIKLIEEDADSFARRAEMYYKRRPELMKLVEEFYRAYRALAERYNHATVELRLAHRTMAEAFPDEVPYSLSDESLSNASLGTDPEPHTPKINHPIRAFLDLKGLASEPADKGLTQVCESEDAVHLSFQHGLFQLSSENKNLKMKVVSESERASRAEIEVQTLKSILSQIQGEKDSIRVEYEKNLENLSYLKRELNHAQEDAKGLDERAGKAEIEIKILKETLVKLEAERDAILLKYNENLKMITSLEVMLGDSELESQDLKQKLLRLEAEKEAGLLQYHQCLETISTLESKISLAELDAKKLIKQTNEAERRTQELVEAVNKSNEEKEAVAFLYKKCLETLGKMEAELSRAQDEAKRLNSEIVIGAEKLKMAEEQSCLLAKSNQFLQCEAENLAQKIYVKDKELMQKNEELKNLQSSARDGHTRFNQVDASLETLQNLYYGSQEEQRALALEIRSSLQILKDLEALKLGLEEEMQQVKEENRSLNEINLASTLSEKNLREELGSLRELTDKLEEDFAVQAVQNDALQEEINYLMEEISSLGVSYGLLMMQVEELRDENLELRGAREQYQERENLLEKLKRMDDISKRNSALEMSLCELNGALGESREMVKQLQESCQSLVGEKSSLLGDKAALLSQLQMVTENMQKLLEKNASLETSLCAGRAEVEGLREKSQRVDEICQLLINEKSDILMERSSLALQLENVEKGLGNLERRFENLEEKCLRQEKEKEMTLSQVEELQGYLGLEKQERITYIQSNEARLAALEHKVKFLQEEIQLRKKEFEEEVEKAVISQLEIFILQKKVEDLEEKNLSLLFECQKQVEASKLSSKLISELESENFEQQVELEMLSDEVGRLRREIYQVFRALQIDPEIWYRDGAGKERVEKILMHHILDKIENMKSSLMKNKDEKLRLLIENSLVSTVLGQVRMEGEKLMLRKEFVEKELEKIKEQCFLVEKEKTKLLKESGLLKLQVTEGCEREKGLLSNLRNLREKLDKLQLENLKMDEENRVLHEKIVLSQDENCALMEENGEILEQAITVGNLSVVFESFAEEKVCEMKTLCQDLHEFYEINSRLKDEVRNLKEQLGVKGEENLHLMRSLEKFCGELHEVKDLNDQFNHQIMMGNDLLQEKARELSEVENKLEESHCSTFELDRTVQELSREHEELKKGGGDTKEEIESLLRANRQLETEMSRLREEIEEKRAREESLSSELQEKSKENELWEAEASSFYLDLQISGVREVLLQNKVHELIEICKTLKRAGGTKIEEVEHMKERVGFLEREIGGLKSQLFAYAAVISSLRDDMPSFKQHALLQRQLCVKGKLEMKGEEESTNRICKNHQELEEDHNAKLHAGISDLQIMHNRFEAVEKTLMKEMGRLKMERAEDLRNQLTSIGGTRESKTLSQLLEEKVAMGKEIESEVYSSRTGLLNQVSDSSFSESSKRNFRDEGPVPDSLLSTVSEIIEQKKSENFTSKLQFEKELGTENLEISSKEVYRRKFLERLISDAQKLSSIRTNVEDIRRKATMSRVIKKMGKNADLEAVERQLQEVEEVVEQLMVSNDHLMKDIDGNHDHSVDGSGPSVEVENVSGTVHEKKVQEQVEQEIQKIERLQFKVQDIQWMVKMNDDKKAKGKNRFKRIGRRLLLRDLICSREGTGKRKLKKGSFFCCSRSSIKGD